MHEIYQITATDANSPQYSLWIQSKVREHHVTVNIQQNQRIIGHDINKLELAQIGLMFLGMAGSVDTEKLVEVLGQFQNDDIHVLRQTLANVLDSTWKTPVAVRAESKICNKENTMLKVWDELWAEMLEHYRADNDQWVETTAEMYDDQLGAVPPERQGKGSFLVGEAWNHNADGHAVYACFICRNERYYACYMTKHKWDRLFSKSVTTPWTMNHETCKLTLI